MAIDLDQSHRIRTGFAEWAPTYDDDTKGAMKWAAPQCLTSLLRPHLFDGVKILDLGCGTGQAPEYLKDLKLEWTGVDLCAAMLKQARESGRYQHTRRMNVERRHYPFARNSFDAVMAGGVLEFTSRLDQVLKQVCRILKPGAHVAFSVELPDRGTEFDVLDSEEYYYIRYRYSESLARQYIQQAGLECRQTEKLKAYRSDEGVYVRYACFLARKPDLE